MANHVSPAVVVKVGGGRGFIIEHRVKVPPMKARLRHQPRGIPFVKHQLVVTAAHCLPHLPPVPPAYDYERTYKDLLGNLHGRNRKVWAECLFADPVGDIAVLGSPSTLELSDKADAYDALVDERPAIEFAKARSGRGWILALSGDRWIETTLKVRSTIWGPSLVVGPTEAGMSGSPILNDAGRAVAIVSQGHETVAKDGVRKNQDGAQPILALKLPGWLLEHMK
jgi:hypothetical protein